MVNTEIKIETKYYIITLEKSVDRSYYQQRDIFRGP